MWSAITSYLGDVAPPPTAAPSTPRRSSPESPRKLSSVMSSSAEKRVRKTTMTTTDNIANKKDQEVIILKGIVVGTKKSGKTSLLRRLRSEDITDGETRKLMALLPWKVPNEVKNSAQCIDDEVMQLYLSEAVSFSSLNNQSERSQRNVMGDEWRELLQHATRKQSRKQVDFVVWMVDGRKNKEDVVTFLKIGLESLFFSCNSDESDKDARRGKVDCDKSLKPKQSPVQSMCILINFRDIQQEDNMLLEQLRRITNEVLAKYSKSTNTSITQQPSVLIYESSMLTHFGMQSLQSFITLPYLQYKEKEYERRIRELRRGYDTVKRGLLLNNTKSYDDFVKENGFEHKECVATTLKSQHAFVSKTESGASCDNIKSSRKDEYSVQAIPEKNIHRQLFPTKQVTDPSVSWTPLNTHQTLDSFFSDDEESCDENSTSDHQDQSEKLESSLSSDVVLNSDDDSIDDYEEEHSGSEFYIDNTGQRNRQSSVFKTKQDSNEPEKMCSRISLEEKKDDDDPTRNVADDSTVDKHHFERNNTNTSNHEKPKECSLHDRGEPEINENVQVIDNDVDDVASVPNEGVENADIDDTTAIEPVRKVDQESARDNSAETDFDKSSKVETNTQEEGDGSGSEYEDITETNRVHAVAEIVSVAAETQIVLDSDDESTTRMKKSQAISIENETTSIGKVQCDNEPTSNKPTAVAKAVPTISSAALAAILEAERALGDANLKPKKNKKEKKKSKSKKSKKKESKG